MTSLLQDARYGLRVMSRSRGFAAVAVITLALGIGANAAIFSVVNAILLRPLPYPNPDQLVGLGQWRNQAGEGYLQTGVAAPNAMDIAKTGVFQQVAYYRWAGFNITEGDRPESVDSIRASAELLPMFGVQPMLGRFFRTGETEAGRDGVAVIGYRLWQMRYGSDASVLGKTIDLDQRKYTIIGVMPASFRFTWDQEMDVFAPLVLTPEERSEAGRGTSRDLQTQARLKPGVSVVHAQAAMDTLAHQLAARYPETNRGWGFKVEPLHAAYHRRMQTPLMIMLGAVMLVLLIACVNVANLLLARATGRKREIAIRLSIGATRGRLVTQLLTESCVLAICGGVLGLLLAFGADRLLTFAMTHYGLSVPNAKIIDIDWRVLLFSAGVTLITGILFGLVPSWATTKTGLSGALKEGAVGTTSEGTGRRIRSGLVVCEMALALVLLTGAGLLVRTFVSLASVDLGIDPRHVVTMGISLPDYRYPSPSKQEIFYRELTERVESLPGVLAAGAQSGGSNVFFQPEGEPAALPGQEPTASYKIISRDFLKTMKTRLILGREFTERDSATSTRVALISQTVARRYFPGVNPVGKHLMLLAHVYSGQSSGQAQPLEIVGVVNDVRNEDLWRPEPAIYVPFAQKPGPSVLFAVRTVGEPLTIVPAVRDAVLALDKQQPLNHVLTMDQIISETYGAIRFPMTLLWIFSALALTLSAVGIFGVMSYTVSRRTKELAIRMALGASQGEMLQLVLREGALVTLIGIVIGLTGALALSRVMAGYVYGISSRDPLTFLATSMLLAAVALFATYLPARRAAKVDPTVALRYE